jgi:hypothetical protein
MDADLPTPDRVDLDPYEVDDVVIAPDDGAPLAEADLTAADERTEATPVAEIAPAPAEPAAVDGVADPPDGRLDLDAIEADLAGVEVALARLSDGTYWTDDVTREPLADDVSASSPTARHV